MVYSTCSLNPVENEAVVYNLLLKFPGQLELVDARDQLPGLITRRGLSTWNLMGKNGRIYASWFNQDLILSSSKNVQLKSNCIRSDMDEVTADRVDNLIRPPMFPPEASVAADLHLDRCMRVMPHDQVGFSVRSSECFGSFM